MLKNNGKKTAISVACTACLCLLLLLLVAVQHHRVQVSEVTSERDIGMRALLQDATPGEGESAPPESARDKKGFSAYFTKLTRGRREVEKPARSFADPPPAENISADDIFIAVKTTKKFHQSRLSLLLETWISRNVQQVNVKSVAWNIFSSLSKHCACTIRKLKISVIYFVDYVIVTEPALHSCNNNPVYACRWWWCFIAVHGALLFPLSPDDILKRPHCSPCWIPSALSLFIFPWVMSLRTEGAVSELPLLNPPLSPLSIIPPLLRCPCECPRCNGCFTATDSNAVPLPGLTKLLSEGGRKAFPAPCLPSLHGNVGAESGSSLVEGWERGGFV